VKKLEFYMQKRFQTVASTIYPKVASLGSLSILLISSTLAICVSFSPVAYADTLGYPWPTDTEAPCEFGSAGGSSCTNPNNSSDMYDWGIYVNGVFQPYRNGYEYRNCTDYTQWKESTVNVSVPTNWLNGGQWYSNAPTSEQSTTPKAWDAAVVPGSVGHVAFVQSVNTDGTITVSEYNHDAQGHGDTRTGTASSMGFTEFVDFGVHPSNSAALTPAAISFNGALNVFKVANDDQVYNQYWNGSSWSGWASLGGTMVSNPAVIVNGSALNVFVRGVDNQIYTEYNGGSGWSGWASLGSHQMKGNPTVMFYGSSLNVFALDTNNVPYEDTWTSANGWTGWNSNGNSMASDPAAVSYGGKLHLIYRGGDNVPYDDVFNGTSWGGFGSLGGGVAGNPSVLSYGAESELDVYFNTSNNQMWKTTYNGTSWSSWSQMGSSFVGDPYITTYGNDLEVYSRDTSNHIETRYWSYSSQTWSGWASLGGTLASDPYALQYGSSELDVLASDSSNNTYKNTFQPTPGWSGFSQLN
jgi:surface antigen